MTTQNAELFAQIQKLLDPTGRIVKGAPNLTPTKGSEKEQHTPHEKKAFIGDAAKKLLPAGSTIGEHLAKHDHHYDLAGLGMLAAPAGMELAHEAGKEKGTRDKGAIGKAALELGGLGLIAAPVAAAARGFKHASAVIDELEKIGFVSDAEAENALSSIKALEQDKPTKRQTLGYMGAGAALTPAFHMAGNAIRKRPLLGDATELKNLVGGARVKHQALDAASHAVKGGLGGTAVSMAQRHIDRSDKTNTLKAYLAQHETQMSEPDLQKAGAAKEAGFLDSAKKLLTTPIEGTPTLLAGRMPSSPKPAGGPSANFQKWQASQSLKKAAGAPRLVGPKMPGLAGSGTPAMPMPKPQPVGIGVG